MNSRSKPTQAKQSRRLLLKGGVAGLLATIGIVPRIVWSKHYLDVDEARNLIWGEGDFSPVPVELSKEQMKSIRKTSKTRVRSKKINAFRNENGDWFILDQVIGKHENIDIAVGIDVAGKVRGIEVLEYRESYGYEIMNPKWRAQFHGRDASEVLKLDKQIRNISGATLSCRHITDGINRLTVTWEQVLQYI
ncbi:MAG: FMN-binding protein [Pseudomonadota bacterium]